MEYINTSDTLCLRPNYAFAEWRWWSNDKNPDSLLVDSTELWQAVIGIPQLKNNDIPYPPKVPVNELEKEDINAIDENAVRDKSFD